MRETTNPKSQTPNSEPKTPGQAGHDRMVELVERMLKLHVPNRALTADGLCGAEFPARTEC
jgi:hypothetical protein